MKVEPLSKKVGFVASPEIVTACISVCELLLIFTSWRDQMSTWLSSSQSIICPTDTRQQKKRKLETKSKGCREKKSAKAWHSLTS